LISFLQQHPIIDLFAFVAFMVMFSALLAYLSGWFRLVDQYPDQPEKPLLRVRWQSGTLGRNGGARGTLTLSACPSGLRVGVPRVMAPFCRPLFVPWEHLTIVRENTLLGPIAKLQFGNPVSTIPISAYAANRLARAAGKRWPEAGPIPEERGAYVREILVVWAIGTSLPVLFFVVVPLVVGNPPPILLAIVLILLPALFFGAGSLVRFLFEVR
jgi:hypothetical protein